MEQNKNTEPIDLSDVELLDTQYEHTILKNLLEEKIVLPEDTIKSVSSNDTFFQLYDLALKTWHEVDPISLKLAEEKHKEFYEENIPPMMTRPAIRSDTTVIVDNVYYTGQFSEHLRMANYKYVRQKVIEWLLKKLTD
jgi:hypothetical protein